MSDVKEKLLFQMTGQEFIDLMKEGLALFSSEEGGQSNSMNTERHYVYGYKGLQELLGISSDSTVWRLLKSGAIDPAVSKYGKILVTDSELALELLKVSKHRERKPRGGYA